MTVQELIEKKELIEKLVAPIEKRGRPSHRDAWENDEDVPRTIDEFNERFPELRRWDVLKVIDDGIYKLYEIASRLGYNYPKFKRGSLETKDGSISPRKDPQFIVALKLGWLVEYELVKKTKKGRRKVWFSLTDLGRRIKEQVIANDEG